MNASRDGKLMTFQSHLAIRKLLDGASGWLLQHFVFWSLHGQVEFLFHVTAWKIWRQQSITPVTPPKLVLAGKAGIWGQTMTLHISWVKFPSSQGKSSSSTVHGPWPGSQSVALDYLSLWLPLSTKPPNSSIGSDQIRSVAQSCPTLCDPMNHSTPGLPIHHQLPEFTETHVHRVSDAIQPSHPLSSPSPPAPNPSQHQSLFQ